MAEDENNKKIVRKYRTKGRDKNDELKTHIGTVLSSQLEFLAK